MEINLGRINIFIGENGSGKSNILEAIALAGAAAANKLDNEFLASRGIRTAEPGHMRCALNESYESVQQSEIQISISSDDKTHREFKLSHDGRPYSSWKSENAVQAAIDISTSSLLALFEKLLAFKINGNNPDEALKGLAQVFDVESIKEKIDLLRAGQAEGHKETRIVLKSPTTQDESDNKIPGTKVIQDFVIYSPENLSLRIFQREGQIEPLGIQGEGLLKFLKVLNETSDYSDTLVGIRRRLSVLGWFEDLQIPNSATSIARKIEIKDRYVSDAAGHLDQISANEGFLFLLFYFSLFSTDLTPDFFAIDNVDASLNPKLCAHLITQLVEMANQHNKQAILTTHNPATLDGLDLNDDSQRLFVVSRGDEGETRIRRIERKEGSSREVKLSTAFINGYLGGLPKSF